MGAPCLTSCRLDIAAGSVTPGTLRSQRIPATPESPRWKAAEALDCVPAFGGALGSEQIMIMAVAGDGWRTASHRFDCLVVVGRDADFVFALPSE